VNLNSALSGGRLNEFVYQYSYFKNFISANSDLPYESFPGGVTIGQSINTPQTTEQHKHQFRDDFSWTMGKHDLRAGASFIYEPTLDITFSTGQVYQYTHLGADRNSPITSISKNGSIGGSGGSVGRIPNNQYAFVLPGRLARERQADRRHRRALRPRHGLRLRPDNNIIFAELTAAAKAGKFRSQHILPLHRPRGLRQGSPRKTPTTSLPVLASPTTRKADGEHGRPRRPRPLL
jgi:hypothetical protein